MGIVTSRRTVLGLLAAGTASVAAPWVVRPAMAQSKTVNITTYDGFLPPEFARREIASAAAAEQPKSKPAARVV